MRLTQFMSVADDRGCRIQVNDGGEISLVAQQSPPSSVSELTTVVLPLTAREANHLAMWLNMAITAANGTTASDKGTSGAPGA